MKKTFVQGDWKGLRLLGQGLTQAENESPDLEQPGGVGQPPGGGWCRPG